MHRLARPEGETVPSHVSRATQQPLTDASVAYGWYVVGVLWVVLLLRFVDLQVISVLLESIRSEFHVSDTQLGLLTGTAFAIFYGIFGLPISWLADRYSRRNIIAGCLGLWSLMTALCGLTTTFAALLLARLGVGFGEAGGIPPSYSLVSDYFPPSRRSTVFAVLNSAVPVGVFVGYLVGGTVNAHLGWRATLIAFGVFGVLVAAVVRLTVLEPRRGQMDDGVQAARSPFRETIAYLWRLSSYRHLVLATSIFTLGANGTGAWMASFFIRIHGLSAAEATTWLAFVYGGGGLMGALLGGVATEKIARVTGNAQWYAWLPAAAAVAILPIAGFVYLTPHAHTALWVQLGITFLMHSWMGPVYSTVQRLAGASRRAFAAGINLLVVNVISLGLGPLVVGVLSDAWGARSGGVGLRYAILSLTVIAYSWAAVHFVLAGRTLRKDLPAVSRAATRALHAEPVRA